MTNRPLTVDQIVALAPDGAAARAGQGLATARKWLSAGQDDRAVWGECAGSGAQPYQVAVDGAETAFRCSCPSRKIPCKHVLGLLMLRAIEGSAVPVGPRPTWVSEWIAIRDARAEQRAAGPAVPKARVAGPDAAPSSRERREERVAAGFQGLARWLEDLVRQGLASLPSRPYAYWEEAAARLVDAQAPGAARLVRRMARIPSSGPGWPDRLLEAAARLHLLVDGSQRVASLPAGAAEDLRAAVGWTLRQEEVLAGEGVPDRWAVLGRRLEGEDRLRVQRTWLWGEGSGRVALLLVFAHSSQPLDAGVGPGTWVTGEVAFYPGGAPLRAVLREGYRIAEPLEQMPGHRSIPAAVAAYAGALARNPWLELFPLSIRGVVPARNGEVWTIRDGGDRVLPLHRMSDDRAWALLAVSGGAPIDVFGEWDGRHLYPISAFADGRFLSLDTTDAMAGAA